MKRRTSPLALLLVVILGVMALCASALATPKLSDYGPRLAVDMQSGHELFVSKTKLTADFDFVAMVDTRTGKVMSAVQASDPPPSNLAYSAVYVPATHTVAPMVGYRPTTIQRLFGVKLLSPDLFILAGYDVVKSKILGGFALLFHRPIAENVSVQFGPGGVTGTDGRLHFAACGSVNIRL